MSIFGERWRNKVKMSIRYGVFFLASGAILSSGQGDCSTQEDYSAIYKQDLFSPTRRPVVLEKPGAAPPPPPPEEGRNRIALRGIVETGGIRRACLVLQGGNQQVQGGGGQSGTKTVILAPGETLEGWVLDKVLEKSVEMVGNEGQRLQMALYDTTAEGKASKEKKQAVGLLTKPAPPPVPPTTSQAAGEAVAQAEGEAAAPPEAVEQNKATEEERLAEEARREHATKVRKQRAEEAKKRRESMATPPAPPPVPSALHQTPTGQQPVRRTIQIKGTPGQQQNK